LEYKDFKCTADTHPFQSEVQTSNREIFPVSNDLKSISKLTANETEKKPNQQRNDECETSCYTQESGRCFLTEAGSSKLYSTPTLKLSELEIETSVAGCKPAIESETTSDPQPAPQNDFTVLDQSKNFKKHCTDHSDLANQNSADHEQLSSLCHSIYDIVERRRAYNLFNVPFCNSSPSTSSYVERMSCENPGLHRSWNRVAHKNLKKRKKSPLTFVNSNDVENCLFGKKQATKYHLQSSKHHHLSPSVSIETMFRPLNNLRGGKGKTYSDNNDNRKQCKLP